MKRTHRYLIISIIAMLSYYSVAQDTYPKISFEFGYNYQLTDMTKFNHHLDLIKTETYKLDDYLDYVHNYKLILKIKPSTIFDFGVYFGNQSMNLERSPILKKLNPDLTTTEVKGYHKNEIRSIDIGLASTIYLNYFLKVNNKILQDINFGIDLQVGIGFSKYHSESHVTTFTPISVSSAIRKANGLQGQIGISAEYSLFKSPFITALGLKLGYQLYKTHSLKDEFNIKWGDPNYDWTSADEEINLDFSGFYFGVYLKIGK